MNSIMLARCHTCVIAIVAFSTALISGCASVNQQKQDVFWRRNGGQLEFWKKLPDAAVIHWPYAWAAVAAYQDSDDPKRKLLTSSETCPAPHILLAQRGWVRWSQLPMLKPRKGERYAKEAEEMRKTHLRAEVWSNAQTKRVIVAFGGTAASSWDDWKANGRWFFGFFNSVDQYTVLTDTFIPAFVTEYKRLASHPDWTWLRDAHISSTGHSLGGGLAQRFAYSLHKKNDIPVVTEVFAFDPSPVSGKRSTTNYPEQANGLIIYRIYNRGEALASLRILERVTNPGHMRNDGQKWIDIRYLSNWSWRTLLPSGSVHAHGMHDLARFMLANLPSDKKPQCADIENE